MIDIQYINNYFPSQLTSNAAFQKHILKEYIQVMVLDYLATTPFVRKIAFIGGTNLRLIMGIDRFSEDLDFDCKDLTEQEFMEMTDDTVAFLRRTGLNVETRDKVSSRLTAYRRNIYFPALLFELGLTGHKEERFLLKIEAQDQMASYPIEMRHVQRCGFFFSLPTPPYSVMLSMKFSALLARAKGRDFYDCMFLMQHTKPSYDFLSERVGICTPSQLKDAIKKRMATVDLGVKKRDFEHLLFNTHSADRILQFPEYVENFFGQE